MKKIALFFASLVVAMASFAAIPTKSDLADFYEPGQLCVCVQFEEPVCNDIVFIGSYNGWDSSDPASMAHFAPLEGFDGWYYVAVTDNSATIEGKPVQLMSDGSFSWDYQGGDADAWTIHAGYVDILPGYNGECDLKNYSTAEPVILTCAYFKYHNTPCGYVTEYKDYTIRLLAPDCAGADGTQYQPAIIGDFNNWSEGVAAYEIDTWTSEYVFHINARVGSSFKFRALGYTDWSNEIILLDEISQYWYAPDNIVLGTDTEISIDYSAGRYALCVEDVVVEDSIKAYTIRLLAPDCAGTDGTLYQPAIIGSFNDWTEGVAANYIEEETSEYVFIINDKVGGEFKFKALGDTDWTNEIQLQDEFGNWYNPQNITLGTETEIFIDYSAGRYTFCVEDTPVLGNIVYELNGGVTNDYGWLSKADMWETFKVDAGVTSLATLDELKAAGDGSLATICTPLATAQAQAILDNEKWDWLEAYIMTVQNADAAATVLTEGASSAGWRYAMAAFFLESKRASWPISADFSQAGKYEAFQPAWKHAFANPTEPTGEWVLNAPYKEGETFLGWYWNADFSGEKVTVINAESNGTLYAKFGEYVPTSDIPTKNDLVDFYEPGQLCVCIKFEEPVCNDIVFIGSYNGWDSSDPASMAHFAPLEGFEGWYYVAVTDESAEIQGKPVQLMGDGSFAWDYQGGDVDAWTIHAGYVDILPGYNGECDLKNYSTAEPVIMTCAYFKNHNTPCGYVVEYKDYTIRLNAPFCAGADGTYYDPAIIGDFNGWTEGVAATYIDEKTFEYVFELKQAEKTKAFKFKALGDIDWSNQIQLQDEYGYWYDNPNLILGDDTEISIDYSAGRYTLCVEDVVVEDSIKAYTIRLLAPDCAGADGTHYQPAIIGTFNDWTEGVAANYIEEETSEYVFIINDKVGGEFKFKALGDTDWSNQIQLQDEYGYWYDNPNLILGDDTEISIDYSAGRYTFCVEDVVIEDSIAYTIRLLAPDCAGADGTHYQPAIIGTFNDWIEGVAADYIDEETSEYVFHITDKVGGEFKFKALGDTDWSNEIQLQDELGNWYNPQNLTLGTDTEISIDYSAGRYTLCVEDTPVLGYIVYELNGGVTNDYGWLSKGDMWETFKVDAGITSLATLDELKAAGDGSLVTICTPLGAAQAQAILDNEKWDWLEAYIMTVQNADAAASVLTEGASSAGWRYAMAAFFLESKRAAWPVSADFTIAGTVEAFQPAWKHAFANPTEPTGEWVLNAPYKEGYTFDGWYATADFSGERVKVIDATTTGTLYAKWVEYIPTIAEVKALADDTETKVAGVVNFISGKNVYIQDATGGILVYTTETPNIIVGERIVAKGVKVMYGGAPEVKSAVIESAETAELPTVVAFNNLATLIADTDFKHFATRVSVPGLTIVSYDSYNNPTVEDALGNQALCYRMVLDPVEFPIGKKVNITAVAGWYNGFQFVGDAAGIEHVVVGAKDTYAYPVRHERYSLTNNWVISNVEDNYFANKPGSNDMVRGMAAKDGIMYFINRETESLVRVDGTTGEMLDPLQITGEHLFRVPSTDAETGETSWSYGVTIPFNDLKFDQAGNCLISGLITSPNQYFMVYEVDLETGAATLVVSEKLGDNPDYAEIPCRFDAFGVNGDIHGNACIMVADAMSGSWNTYRWLIEDGVVGKAKLIKISLDPQVDNYLASDADGFGTAPQIFPQDETGSLFYVDGFNTTPMLFNESGRLVDDFINVPTGLLVANQEGDTIEMNTRHNGLVDFQVGNEHFLIMAATNTVHNVPSTFALYKFADKYRSFKGLEPLWYFPANGMGNATNGYRVAVPSVEVNGNEVSIYLYTGENGYASYTLHVDSAEIVDPSLTDYTIRLNAPDCAGADGTHYQPAIIGTFNDWTEGVAANYIDDKTGEYVFHITDYVGGEFKFKALGDTDWSNEIQLQDELGNWYNPQNLTLGTETEISIDYSAGRYTLCAEDVVIEDSIAYTIRLLAPDCAGADGTHYQPAIIGTFNDWTEGVAANYIDDKTGEYVFHITDKVGGAFKFRALGDTDWSNQIQLYDEEYGWWYDNYDLPLDTETEISIDYSAGRYTFCVEDVVIEDSIAYTIRLLAPDCAGADGTHYQPAIIGTFNDWIEGVAADYIDEETSEYVFHITDKVGGEFKFKALGDTDWTNEIQLQDEFGNWYNPQNITLGTETEISIDYSAGRYTLCVEDTPPTSDIPTQADLAPYYEPGQLCVCIKFEEEVCNDIVFAGSYNDWDTSDPASMAKFTPLEGFEGWYYVAVTDESATIEGKPVQLMSDGSFDWKYQGGDAKAWTIHSGYVDILPGYDGECDLKNYSTAEPVIMTCAYFKNHNTPCGYVVEYKDYTIRLNAPFCAGADGTYYDPAIIGDFNDWTEGVAANYIDDWTLEYVFHINAKVGSAFKFRALGDTDWSNQIQLQDEYGNWYDNPNLIFGNDTEISIDYSAGRYTLCQEEIITLDPVYATICYGETYYWNGDFYRESGVYTVQIDNFIHTLYLTVLPEATTETEIITVNETELPYIWHDQALYDAGTYHHYIQSEFGCDSIHHILHLSVEPAVVANQCGDNLYWTYEPTTQELSITGYGDMYDYTAWTQPWNTVAHAILSISLPEGMTSIGASAFADCKFVTNITIPASVEVIGFSAFENCRMLSDLTFAEGGALSMIGNWAFYNCHELQNIAIPEGVTEIGYAAFYGCTYLSELTLPASMQYIADNGFALCAKLTSMTVNATVPPTVAARTFEEVDRTIPVYVPQEAVDLYKTAPVWQEFYIVGKLPSSVDNLPTATDKCQKLIRDGQLIILHDGKTYNAMGQEL